MALLELNQFYQEISNLKAPSSESAFLVYGQDEFLKREIFTLLKEKFTPENPEFNWIHFELAKAEWDAIYMDLQAYPMFADYRVIVIEISDACPEIKIKALREYLAKNLSPTSKVIIQWNSEDNKKVTSSKLTDLCMSVECRPPYAYQVGTWINQLANRYYLTFDPHALLLFHEWVGDQLAVIDLELKKFAHHQSTPQLVTEQQVRATITRQAEANIFEWIRLLLKRNKKVQTYQELKNILDSGESPLAVTQLLARHIRILLKREYFLHQGLRGPKLAQALKIPPYFLKKYDEDSKAWSTNQLKLIINQLAQLDRQLKSSKLSVETLLLNWVQAIE